MKILFISRAFPPILGGIENQNYELLKSLEKTAAVDNIINYRGKTFLPFFLPYALLLGLVKTRKADVILLGDGLLSPLGFILQTLSNTPCFCILHGLDISFNNRFYQYVINKFSLPKLKHCFAVGNSTKALAIEKGIQAPQISFIPNGVRPNLKKLDDDYSPTFATAIQKPFILSLGRLIKRKGVIWFIDNVVENLPKHIQYVIAGDGPEREAIQQRLENHNNIIYLGLVDEQEKQWLYQNCLAFIQPNIRIKNDIEGFGLVVLEAAINNAIVIASNLEGLKDAIKDTKNGYLITSEDSEQLLNKIKEIDSSSDEQKEQTSNNFRNYSLKHYHWDTIGKLYIEKINSSL